jgi:alkanesulfonate monooxygenase SsuD/methylene tetrahydromethanopterin reductase-like flavin-dependent oxidoreductase (luciferase family)
MRFAFKTSPQDTTWEAMLAVWRAADDIEVFESGWTFDHFYPIFSDPTGPCLEGWVTLVALAQATTRLRLGTLVTGIHYRHPAVLAKMAAALDIVSGGRLELGIGAGWNEEESGAYGIELGTSKEAQRPVRRSLRGHRRTAHAGDDLVHRELLPVDRGPVQPQAGPSAHPPICIGGSGEKRTLRTTARFAQHWNFVGGTVEQFATKRAVLHRHCADIGRDPAEILLSSHVPFDRDPAASAATAAALGEAGAGLAIIYLRPPLRPDVLEPLAEALTALG